VQYQVGHLTFFEKDDPLFDSLEAAMTYVRRDFSHSDHPMGVWTDHTGGNELIAIYHEGKWFRG